jgi:hypothetical protein
MNGPIIMSVLGFPGQPLTLLKRPTKNNINLKIYL